MSKREFDFDFIEREVRKKTFGVFTVIDPKGRPHSTGILYGVAPPESKFALYMVTDERYAKARHVRQNPNVSLVITFPHYYIRFAPASYVMFRGTAELVSLDEPDAQWAFNQKRILRMNQQVDSAILERALFIKIKPEPTVFCYGVGFGLMELRSNHMDGSYKVTIPSDRL